MINLTATTDKLQVVTASGAAINVHASFVDFASGTVTPGKQNTAISASPATTDVVAAPSASTTRNVKAITVLNIDATTSTNVVVQFNANGTLYQLAQVTLAPGDSLEYFEGRGFFYTASSATNSAVGNANTSDVTASASDTYITGSSINIAGRVKAGSLFHWRFVLTKTGAGTATPIFTVRCGTAGTTSDTSLGTFTGVAQTAATDTAWIDIEAAIRNASSSGILQASFAMQHKGTTTGFANAAQVQLLQFTSGTFDFTANGLILGVSCTPGASGVWTFQNVGVVAANLK